MTYYPTEHMWRGPVEIDGVYEYGWELLLDRDRHTGAIEGMRVRPEGGTEWKWPEDAGWSADDIDRADAAVWDLDAEERSDAEFERVSTKWRGE